tara:strand:- start:352 stop:1533 length:1182 start_codon:yes stop_codon:yes gene_type:complete
LTVSKVAGYNIGCRHCGSLSGDEDIITANCKNIAETELKSGETLVIKKINPPLESYADNVTCWDVVRDDLLVGVFEPWLFTPYYIGEIQGDVVGSMACFTPVENPEVGLVEFVNTEENHRRKGVSTALLRQLISHFEVDGGLALYLCTTNPVAGRMYENCGFSYLVGDGMRYLTREAGDFDAGYLAKTGAASVRQAHWGDLPGVSALFCHREPAWEIKEYLSHCFKDTRFEGHFMRLMRRIEEDRGVIQILENDCKRVVGCVIVERLPTFHQQHVAHLSIRVAPDYGRHSCELLDAAVDCAHQIGISILQSYVAECDADAKDVLAAASFTEEAVLRGRLRTTDGFTDLAVYSRILSEVPPQHSQHKYYGERQPWQTERIHELGKAMPRYTEHK